MTPHSTPMEHAIKISIVVPIQQLLWSIIEWHLQTGFRDNDSIWKSFSFYLRVILVFYQPSKLDSFLDPKVS